MKRLLFSGLLIILSSIIHAQPIISNGHFQQIYEMPDTYAELIAGPYLVSLSSKPASPDNQCAKEIKTLLLLDKATGKQLYEYEIGTDNNSYSTEIDLTFDENYNRLWVMTMNTPTSGDCSLVTPQLYSLSISQSSQKPVQTSYQWSKWSEFNAGAFPGDLAVNSEGVLGYTVDLQNHRQVPVPQDKDLKNGWFCLLDPQKSHVCNPINITIPEPPSGLTRQEPIEDQLSSASRLKKRMLLKRSLLNPNNPVKPYYAQQLLNHSLTQEDLLSRDDSTLCWPYFDTIKLDYDNVSQQFVLLVLGCGWVPLLIGLDHANGQEKWKIDLSPYKLNHPNEMYMDKGYVTIILNAGGDTQRRIFKLDNGQVQLINQSDFSLEGLCELPHIQGNVVTSNEKLLVYQVVYVKKDSSLYCDSNHLLELVSIDGSTTSTDAVALQSSYCQNLLLSSSGSDGINDLLFTYGTNYDDKKGSKNCPDTMIAWDITNGSRLSEIPLPQTSETPKCLNHASRETKILVEKVADDSVNLYASYYTSQNCEIDCDCKTIQSHLVKLNYH